MVGAKANGSPPYRRRLARPFGQQAGQRPRVFTPSLVLNPSQEHLWILTGGSVVCDCAIAEAQPTPAAPCVRAG